MRRRRVLVMVAAAAAMWGAGPLAAPGGGDAWAVAAARGAAVRAAGSWGRAIEVPGLGALNRGHFAVVISVSCASAGTCAAGGLYRDRHGHGHGFVVSERNGRWGHAIEVPGLAALDQGAQAQVISVSCASAGSCAAGGFYRDSDGHAQGFVVSERNGRWGHAIEVTGPGTLNAGGDAGVNSVSCAAAGSCAAGGFYLDGDGHRQGFVVSERNGVWGQAIEVPGLGTLNAGGLARVWSVSCASAGNCAAGGDYAAGHGPVRGFVVSEKNGVWGQAIEVPGLGTLNAGGLARVFSVSCPSAGNCAAGGFYRDRHQHDLGFVVSERNGVWGQAIKVPGIRDLNRGGNASVFSVSCPSAGNCAAGGNYGEVHGASYQGFVVSEKNGVWGRAIPVPGLAALNKGGDAGVSSVSCAPAGSCTAGGSYADGSGRRHLQGFVT